MQFLDITIRFSQDHVCWWYQPRAQKELLAFESAHSITVKRAIALLTLESALQKWCVHKMQDSFNNQIRRLHSTGFSGTIVVAVAKTLLKKVEGVKKAKDNYSPEKTDVIPCLHRVSHNMKKVTERHEISIAFSAPCQPVCLCSRIPGKCKKEGCGKKHSNRYVECAVNVVYEIPLSFGRYCVGRTVRCISDRAGESELAVSNALGRHLPAHCHSCCCEPRFGEIKVLNRGNGADARELVEACRIGGNGGALCGWHVGCVVLW